MKCELCRSEAQFAVTIYDLGYAFVRQSLPLCHCCMQEIVKRVKQCKKDGFLPQTTKIKADRLPVSA